MQANTQSYCKCASPAILALALLLSAPPANSAGALSKSLEPGISWVVDQTTPMQSLTIASGAMITAPLGFSVTMTVNGVETGLRPGTYKGNILLTVTQETPIKFNDSITHQFRQALYVDQSGVVPDKSVLAAAGNYALKDGVLTGLRIRSVGENFNGLYVAGGSYTVKDATIDFTGNGGDDFAGYGAALMSAGPDTRLIVDGAHIRTQGVVRTAAVADKGSHLIVKNSELVALGGTLPADYVPNTALGLMKNVPWLLGISGDNRATNLLGDNSTATYINSSISSESWGVLSVDFSKNTFLTAINSKVSITGKSGYGTYSIGNSTNGFYGTEVRVPDYAAIITGGHVIYAASTPARVAELNSQLNLGLSDTEMGKLPQRATMVHSGRFGLMIWGDATVKIGDDTIFDTAQSTFLIKSAAAKIDVDGSKGAQLLARNGIILQLMETDNPGPVVQNGRRLTIGVYHEPTSPPAKASDFDLAAAHDTDVTANFSHINLQGDFYNAARGVAPSATPAVASVGGLPNLAPPPVGRNLVINLGQGRIAGMITASQSRHAIDTITGEDYRQLGEVTNTPSASINNGVIVSLVQSTWTITGTCYLTSLTVGDGSKIEASKGSTVAMTVDGRPVPLQQGIYKGQIVLTVSKS